MATPRHRRLLQRRHHRQWRPDCGSAGQSGPEPYRNDGCRRRAHRQHPQGAAQSSRPTPRPRVLPRRPTARHRRVRRRGHRLGRRYRHPQATHQDLRPDVGPRLQPRRPDPVHSRRSRDPARLRPGRTTPVPAPSPNRFHSPLPTRRPVQQRKENGLPMAGRRGVLGELHRHHHRSHNQPLHGSTWNSTKDHARPPRGTRTAGCWPSTTRTR